MQLILTAPHNMLWCNFWTQLSFCQDSTDMKLASHEPLLAWWYSDAGGVSWHFGPRSEAGKFCTTRICAEVRERQGKVEIPPVSEWDLSEPWLPKYKLIHTDTIYIIYLIVFCGLWRVACLFMLYETDDICLAVSFSGVSPCVHALWSTIRLLGWNMLKTSTFPQSCHYIPRTNLPMPLAQQIRALGSGLLPFLLLSLHHFPAQTIL